MQKIEKIEIENVGLYSVFFSFFDERKPTSSILYFKCYIWTADTELRVDAADSVCAMDDVASEILIVQSLDVPWSTATSTTTSCTELGRLDVSS